MARASRAGWRSLLMERYWSELFHTRPVRHRLKSRLVAKVRALIRDNERVGTVTDAALLYFRSKYLELHGVQRMRTLRQLARDLGTTQGDIVSSVLELQRGKIDGAQLRREITPAYNRLLQRMISVQGGLHFVVAMRADLLTASRAKSDGLLRELETEMSVLLRDSFSTGQLRLHRLSFDSPASLLAQILDYSRQFSPNPITSWQDLEQRLAPHRRMYAYLHPAYGEIPLVFIEATLHPSGRSRSEGRAKALKDRRHALPPSAEDAPPDRWAAVFTAIAATQEGLRGLSLGELLIKRVVDELSIDRDMVVDEYATFSPVPGFVAYLRRRLEQSDDEDTAAARDLDDGVHRLPDGLKDLIVRGINTRNAATVWDKFLDGAREQIMSLCSHYLLTEKRKRIRALDPVANFHFRNGAIMDDLIWKGDASPLRIAESLGICVRYLYERDQLEHHHQQYTLHGHIGLSKHMRSLQAQLQGQPLPSGRPAVLSTPCL